MKPIFVTGGAGFVGSHVCKALAREGFLPIVYDDLSTGFTWAVKWGPLFKGSLEDKERLRQVLQETNPIGVMHFAARTDARKCQQTPFTYFQTNVGGTANLLEMVQNFEIPYLIFSSTCAVYGTPEKTPIEENYPKNPINVYGETKLIGEKLVQLLPRTQTAILRYFNAAGADPEGELGESHFPATHLIPILIDTALKKRDSFTFFGKDHPTYDGTPIRDYIHVSDLAEAHVKALKYLMDHRENLILNLGTGQGFSVEEIVTAFQETLKYQLPLKVAPKDPADPPCLLAKSKSAQEVLNWQPKLSSLKTLLETTWSWQTR
ncbi:UDP-glucose 4-epimerase GalE [Simkania negevensis]|uniref:UDP-glucose 4-epimerase n=1 Tax=Simkania negevensis (strain ATCC VR-1471 / DSM 27360 / Z) TaxID=331113 RepID=F8L7S0_SIMNZ|nr:UDP-glucose 4-epimerase GalE [Simkania negevensis]CCB88814.1 UDP-glucose 4-epimerase [Simkania negevensis Z]